MCVYNLLYTWQRQYNLLYNGRGTIQINLNLKCIYSWLWCPPVEEDEKKQVFYFSSFALTFPSMSTLSKPLLGFSLYIVLLLLLLSRFSRVRLCATTQTAAHQASPSLGFSRQEHWSGLPFPSPMHESESEVPQSCPTLSEPMDCSPPGSSIHGIFQARVLEWGAIAFSVHCIIQQNLFFSSN